MGRRGRVLGFSSAELLSVEAFREDSDVDGRVSATAIITAPESSGGLIISNSGKLVGGFVVYLVLVFRPGICFFTEFFGRNCDSCSAAIMARKRAVYIRMADNCMEMFMRQVTECSHTMFCAWKERVTVGNVTKVERLLATAVCNKDSKRRAKQYANTHEVSIHAGWRPTTIFHTISTAPKPLLLSSEHMHTQHQHTYSCKMVAADWCNDDEKERKSRCANAAGCMGLGAYFGKFL